MKQVSLFLKIILIFIAFSGMSYHLIAQSPSMQPIPQQLEVFKTKLNPQKIFVHFDREQYSAGETIWLKGYIFSRTDHSPDTTTANVYLELWNVMGEKVQELIFEPHEGNFHGQIEIDPGIPDGNYVIRAYTDWMLNLEESFLFYKYFYISNPGFANSIDNDSRRFNREFNNTLESQQQNLMIQFFPEGGDLVIGLESRVALKLTDAIGRGLNARGSIKDETGKVISGFETNKAGIGLFSLNPEPNKKYVAEINTGGRRPAIEPLPLPLNQGFSLKAEKIDGFLEVSVSYASPTLQSPACALLAHSRGEPVFFKPDLMVDTPQKINIPLSDLPTGITHLTLFSADAKPLAERLVFVNHDDQVYFDIRALMLRAGEANALNIDVLASDEDGTPVEGNFSVAVQYGDVGGRTHHENIFSYLFMSSDLKGLVADPAIYFDYGQDDVETMVDLLMLTHGWRRFSWVDVFTPGKPEIKFNPVYGVDVFGSLVNQQDKSSVGNAELQMRVVEDNTLSFQVKTDSEGNFFFQGLPFPDSLLVEFIPPMFAGRKMPDVVLEPSARKETGVDPMVYKPNVNTLAQQITDRGSNWSRPRVVRSSQAPSRGGQLFGTPDQTIYLNPNEPYSSVIDVLRDKAVGLTISPTGFISIRGVRSINYQSPPLFYIDGIESEGAFFNSHPRDLERIEVFRGASAAVFGARGANGALVAYSKRRDYDAESTSSSVFMVKGLHAPREFFQETEIAAALDPMNEIKTAFWEPLLVTGEDGVASFQFFPLSGVTRYRIVIQGVSEDGKIGYAEFVIGN